MEFATISLIEFAVAINAVAAFVAMTVLMTWMLTFRKVFVVTPVKI
jgi:hypothetical protein